jgi:hypothetical protein
MTDDSQPKRERRYRRIPQYLPADLRMITGAASPGILLHGVVTDLGAAGIHVLLGSPFHPGNRFEVTMNLDGESISFCAIVRHAHWFSSTPGMTFGHGMQITEINEAALYKIVDFVTEELARGRRGLLTRRAA